MVQTIFICLTTELKYSIDWLCFIFKSLTFKCRVSKFQITAKIKSFRHHHSTHKIPISKIKLRCLCYLKIWNTSSKVLHSYWIDQIVNIRLCIPRSLNIKTNDKIITLRTYLMYVVFVLYVTWIILYFITFIWAMQYWVDLCWQLNYQAVVVNLEFLINSWLILKL